MTREEYIEIMDKSNFMIDSANPYDMEIKEALEKQIPKEPLDFGNEAYLCPCCKRNNFYKCAYLDKQNYCDYCGQAIEWE